VRLLPLNESKQLKEYQEKIAEVEHAKSVYKTLLNTTVAMAEEIKPEVTLNELQTQYENDLQELNEKKNELRRLQRKRMTGYIVDVQGLQTHIKSLKQKINNDKLLIKDKIKEKREPKYELSLLQKQRILENKKLKHIAKINKLTTTLNAIEKLLTGEEEVSVPKSK